MKKNNKGFTLVELIVVLVILAILAAILVPALLGWIDKAREKSVTTNAEAAYVAAQGLVTEQYGNKTNPLTNLAVDTSGNNDTTKIEDLTDIEESFKVKIAIGAKSTTKAWSSAATASRDMYKIRKFAYYSSKADKWAVWESSTGTWTVYAPADFSW